MFIDYSYIPLARYPKFDQRYQPGHSTYQLLHDDYETSVRSDRKVIDGSTGEPGEPFAADSDLWQSLTAEGGCPIWVP